MPEHDSSYKLLFSHAEMVADLLRGFVKEEWVNALDFSTLEKINQNYVSDDLRQREDDVIWRVRWGDDWLYIYILLEFQSTMDTWMSVRIMTYVGLLYQDLIRSRQLAANNMLPPVLPIVLYNGNQKWTASTNIRDLICKVPGGLSRYCPSLEYCLIAEYTYRDADLVNLKNLVAALFRLENSRNPEHLMEVLVNLLEWLSDPGQASIRRAFTVWFRRVLFPGQLAQKDYPAIEELTEVRTMLAEKIKEWQENYRREGLQKGRIEGRLEGLQQGLQEGRQEGRLEGLQEGRLEGRLEGAANVLLNLLERKFGPISEGFIQRIKEADEQQIIQWSEYVLTAEKLSDVFGT